jgi:hypothetical protein
VLAISYALAMIATYLWLRQLEPADRQDALQAASTNLAHLGHDPWLVLPVSALFTRGGLIACIVGALICVGLLERVAGSWQTLAVAVTGHLVGTLVSEAVIALRVNLGQLPSSARNALDVGPSYVLVSCACAVIVWPGARRRARFLCAAALVPILVFTAIRLPAGRIDSIGHLLAAAVGLIIGGLVRRDAVAATPEPAR